MRRAPLLPPLLLPLLLLACNRTPLPIQPPTAAEEACAATIDDDPALREARAISAGQPNWEFQHQPEIQQIKRDAITRCLAARGLMPRGGVERPR